jgi:hypothetical protein
MAEGVAVRAQAREGGVRYASFHVVQLQNPDVREMTDLTSIPTGACRAESVGPIRTTTVAVRPIIEPVDDEAFRGFQMLHSDAEAVARQIDRAIVLVEIAQSGPQRTTIRNRGGGGTGFDVPVVVESAAVDGDQLRHRRYLRRVPRKSEGPILGVLFPVETRQGLGDELRQRFIKEWERVPHDGENRGILARIYWG